MTAPIQPTERDECPICGESDEMQDARTLRLAYGYKLDEASVKLQHHFYREHSDADANEFPDLRPFYSIRTCKSCRADFMGLLRSWCAGQIAAGRQEYNFDRNIPVRVDGATVWMTRPEWNAYTGKEPF